MSSVALPLWCMALPDYFTWPCLRSRSSLVFKDWCHASTIFCHCHLMVAKELKQCLVVPLLCLSCCCKLFWERPPPHLPLINCDATSRCTVVVPPTIVLSKLILTEIASPHCADLYQQFTPWSCTFIDCRKCTFMIHCTYSQIVNLLSHFWNIALPFSCTLAFEHNIVDQVQNLPLSASHNI